MNATLFSLVSAESPDLVFAWGMEIEYHEPTDRKAVLYIGGPNEQGSIAIHESAEAARERWSMKMPLAVEWDGDPLPLTEEVDTYEDNDLLRMVSDVNALLSQYVVRRVDVHAGRAGPLPLDTERHLANSLTALADILYEEATHRETEETPSDQGDASVQNG